MLPRLLEMIEERQALRALIYKVERKDEKPAWWTYPILAGGIILLEVLFLLEWAS